MKRVITAIDRLLEHLLVLLMALMVLTVTWQVVTRYVLNNPSSYTEELATYLLIWISLLGAAYAFRTRAHLGIDVLVRKLRGRSHRIAQAFINGAIIAFATVIFIFGGLRLVYVTLKLHQVSAAFRVPIGYIYLVLPLSGVLLVLYALYAMQEDTDRTTGPVPERIDVE